MLGTYIPPIYRPLNLGNVDRMVSHPTLPLLYGSITAPADATWSHSYLYRMEHAEGFPTLIPQRMIVYGFLASTPPVVLPKYNRLAVGGRKRIALFTLDATGKLTTERAEFEVNCPRVMGLAYSTKFDKLYVAADSPPPSKDPKKDKDSKK